MSGSLFFGAHRALRVRYCLTGHLTVVSAAKGGAAKIAGKRTSPTLTAGVRLTAVVLGIAAE